MNYYFVLFKLFRFILYFFEYFTFFYFLIFIVQKYINDWFFFLVFDRMDNTGDDDNSSFIMSDGNEFDDSSDNEDETGIALTIDSNYVGPSSNSSPPNDYKVCNCIFVFLIIFLLDSYWNSSNWRNG